MFRLKISVLFATNMAGDVSTSYQKDQVFLAANTARNSPEVAKISNSFTVKHADTVFNCGHWLGSLPTCSSATIPSTLEYDIEVINMFFFCFFF